MNVNQHIIDNLEFYLKLNIPEYAFLLTGDWGAGKTHFIESFIEDKNKSESESAEKLKIIKISLFGMKSTADVDSKLFQEFHPILGSKYAKFAGNLIKGAISFGIRLDMNSDNKTDGTVNSKLDKIELSEFFSDLDKNKKELVVVFDDLERTDISINDILGYINYFVEISKLKVIILANEKSILDRKDKEIYTSFKEKVIGKTFEVKHDFDEVLESFLKNIEDEKLKKSCNIIKDVYVKSQYKNLRKIKQSIFDFEYLSKHIDKKYFENNEFYSNLVRLFFALSIEVKAGVLNEENLRKGQGLSKRENPKDDIEKIPSKYLFSDTYLYNGNLWANIFFNGDLEGINEATSKLAFFITKEIKEPPSWVKLWNFRELEDEDFCRLIEEVEKDLKDLKEEPLSIYFHKLGLMIYFFKNELSDFSVENIKAVVTQYIDKYKSSENWKNNLVKTESLYNGTGYQYFSAEDADFIEFQNLLYQNNKDVYEKEVEQKTVDKFNDTLNNIQTGNVELFIDFIEKNYRYNSILNKLDSVLLVEKLLSINNSNIHKITVFMNERYSENNFLNNWPVFKLLTEEKSFWESVKQKLEQEVETVQKRLKKHLLKSFVEHTVVRIINLLSTSEVK